MEDNYSVIALKKAVFVDELNNYLKVLSSEPENQNQQKIKGHHGYPLNELNQF